MVINLIKQMCLGTTQEEKKSIVTMNLQKLIVETMITGFGLESLGDVR